MSHRQFQCFHWSQHLVEPRPPPIEPRPPPIEPRPLGSGVFPTTSTRVNRDLGHRPKPHPFVELQSRRRRLQDHPPHAGRLLHIGQRVPHHRFPISTPLKSGH